MKPRKYTPRRASVHRWLAGAPAAVLDCFDHGEKAEPDRFTIILGKEFMQESPRGFHVAYLHCGPDPRGYSGSGEFLAHECAAFRHRSGHRRTRWDALPEAVRAMVERWIEPEQAPARAMMRDAVRLLGTSLALRKGQAVRVTRADNLPQGGYFAAPVNGAWGEDSILVNREDLDFSAP